MNNKSGATPSKANAPALAPMTPTRKPSAKPKRRPYRSMSLPAGYAPSATPKTYRVVGTPANTVVPINCDAAIEPTVMDAVMPKEATLCPANKTESKRRTMSGDSSNDMAVIFFFSADNTFVNALFARTGFVIPHCFCGLQIRACSFGEGIGPRDTI
ncbi:MAG: hypothetical protein L0Y55_04900, partial [Anaerolineales bacterium]|nr:hypothetical protein [Anaerolineales bacterium]